jgi:hypothetical protein
MQNGEGIYNLEDERRERKNGDNLHGAIALPTGHLLKERLISNDSRIIARCTNLIGDFQGTSQSISNLSKIDQ